MGGRHLRHPFRGRLWAEGSELLPWAGSLQAEAVLRDEAERLVLAETRLEEILDATRREALLASASGRSCMQAHVGKASGREGQSPRLKTRGDCGPSQVMG